MRAFIHNSIFDPGKAVKYDRTGASLDVVDRCLREVTQGDGEEIFAGSCYGICHLER